MPPATQILLRSRTAAADNWITGTMTGEGDAQTTQLAKEGLIVTPAAPEDIKEAEQRLAPYWKEIGARADRRPPKPWTRSLQPSDADPAISEGPIERVCHALCGIGLLAMVVIVGVEVVTRNFLGFSFQISDELGGYIIVLISFLSLCVCQVTQLYHHVEFLQARLG